MTAPTAAAPAAPTIAILLKVAAIVSRPARRSSAGLLDGATRAAIAATVVIFFCPGMGGGDGRIVVERVSPHW
jgi:hypothetical protein